MANDQLTTTLRPSFSDQLVVVSPLDPSDRFHLRRFCLATIEEAFGHGYRPDWHGDLDRLGSGTHEYRPEVGGEFLVARRDGEIVGCGGVSALNSRPALAERFANRYTDFSGVGSVWRVYVDSSARGCGLGRSIAVALEKRAAVLGYRRLYLHTSAKADRAMAFWRSRGYEPFCEDADADRTVHFDKLAGPVTLAGKPVTPQQAEDG